MKKGLSIFLMLVMAIGMLTGCKEKQMSEEEYRKLIDKKAADNEKTVAFYLSGPAGDFEITMDWVVYYMAYYERKGMTEAANNKAFYEAMYGEDFTFWKLPSTDGKETLGTSYKNAAFSSIVYSAVMYQEAVKAGISMGDKRAIKLDSTTKAFLEQYTLEERAKCGMSEAAVRKNYERLFLVDAYAEYLLQNQKIDEDAIRETIDKEDYRVYQTDYLYVPKTKYDDNLNKIELSEEELKLRGVAVKAAYQKVIDGKEMIRVREEYDAIMTFSTRDFTRAVPGMEAEYINAATALKSGEVTMLETPGGYYIIRLVDDSEFVGYEDAVSDAIESAKAKDISEIYEKMEKDYKVNTTEAYDSLQMGSYTVTGKK